MTTKNIEFKASINTQEVNKQIQEIQKRLQDMNKTQSYMDRAKSSMGESGPQSERVQKVFKEHQERLLSISKEQLAVAQKNFDLRQKMIERTEALMRSESSSLQTKKQAQELLNKLKEQELELAKKITEETEIQAKAAGEGGGTPGQPPSGQPQDRSGVSSIFKGAVKAFIGRELAQIVQGAGNLIASTVFEGAQNIARQKGNITATAADATGAGLILSGKGAEAAFFKQEREQALKDALDAQGGMTARGLAGMAGSAIGYGAMGLGFGGPIGGALGAAYGAGKELFSGQTGAGISSFLSGEGYSEGVERYRGQVLMDNIRENYEANKNKNIRRKMGFEFMEQNRDRFIESQRSMGMGDKAFFDMLSNTSRGNFTIEEQLGTSNAIMAAGGSTAQARNAGQALALQRDYGLQNAAQVTGLLSKNIGGKGVADKVMEKMLADAFSVGLDSSNFSRETEKFISMSAKFVAESGAETSKSQQSIAALMGNYSTGTSMQRIEAAGTAREEIERMTSGHGTNYEKMLQFAKARRMGIGREDATALMKMTKEQIMAGGFAVEALMESTGSKSIDELLEKKTQMAENTFTKTGRQEELFKKAKEATQTAQKLMGRGKFATNINDLKEAIANESDPVKKAQLEAAFKAQGEFQKFNLGNFGTEAGTEAERSAVFSGMINYGTKRDLSQEMPKQEAKAAEGGRQADAQAQKAQIQNLISQQVGETQSYLKQYADTTKDMANTSKDFLIQLDLITRALASKNKDMEAEIIKEINKMGSMGKGKKAKPSGSGSF